MIIDSFGWIGSVLLAICALPQAIQSLRVKHSDGLTFGLVWLWFLGEVFTCVYVVANKDWPLVFNYGANCLIMLPIVYYKCYPKRS